MTKRLSSWEINRAARAKRSYALARSELRHPSVPRRSPAGVTSAPIKAEDPAVRAMIEAALARRMER